jgi:hypothetical protein
MKNFCYLCLPIQSLFQAWQKVPTFQEKVFFVSVKVNAAANEAIKFRGSDEKDHFLTDPAKMKIVILSFLMVSVSERIASFCQFRFCQNVDKLFAFILHKVFFDAGSCARKVTFWKSREIRSQSFKFTTIKFTATTPAL